MSRALLWLVPVILAAFAVSLMQGDRVVSPVELLAVLSGDPHANPQTAFIVMEIRLPRILLALLCGAALAVAGVIVQTAMQNPLAEPGLLGVNNGAALVVLFIIVHGGPAPAISLQWAAFSGALATALLIYVLAWRNGVTPMRLVLIGIGVGAFAGAASGFLSAFGDIARLQYAQVWLAGSVHDASWNKVRDLALWLLPFLAAILAASRELDLMRFGPQLARSLGQRARPAQLLATLAGAGLAGAAVAAAGPIGFVGLIAPHAAAWLAGPSHARRLPVAALVGALLVMSADLVGRTIIAPAQLPAGLVIALIGAPFFGYLMWRQTHVRKG